MNCFFYAQNVWSLTLTHTNGLVCNFYAQTVWPPTKRKKSEQNSSTTATSKKGNTATSKKGNTAPPWPPTHSNCRSGQELALEHTLTDNLPVRHRYSASHRAINNFLLYTSSSAPLIIMPPKKRDYKFTTHELESLAEAVEDIVPMSTTDWDTVWEAHDENFPGLKRTSDSLKCKFWRLQGPKSPQVILIARIICVSQNGHIISL